MTNVKLKVARIGNSRGVRLPAACLRRYRIGDAVIMEERSDGILLRPVRAAVRKLSWEDTAREMAASKEDWSEWAAADTDGLEQAPWGVERGGRVAERAPAYASRRRRAARRK